MTSYDIENLYCNVPLKETVNIILNRMFTSDSCTFLGLSKQLFRSLLEIATMNSFLIFDGNLYKQCEGLGMGLPQSPAFANMFLSLCWFHLSEVGHSRCWACRSQCSYWSSLIQPFTFSYQRAFPFLWWSSGLPVSIWYHW